MGIHAQLVLEDTDNVKGHLLASNIGIGQIAIELAGFTVYMDQAKALEVIKAIYEQMTALSRANASDLVAKAAS
jgi:hypothetical protein